MRVYTARQFRGRLASVSLLEVDDTHDFRCDVGHPFGLNYEMAYGVFAVITVDRFSIITRFET